MSRSGTNSARVTHSAAEAVIATSPRPICGRPQTVSCHGPRDSRTHTHRTSVHAYDDVANGERAQRVIPYPARSDAVARETCWRGHACALARNSLAVADLCHLDAAAASRLEHREACQARIDQLSKLVQRAKHTECIIIQPRHFDIVRRISRAATARTAAASRAGPTCNTRPACDMHAIHDPARRTPH